MGDLRRASVEQRNNLAAARNLMAVPNNSKASGNGAATIYNPMPGPAQGRGAIPFAAPLMQPQPNEIPPNWQPFEFNGQTYYRIPLANPSPGALAFSR